MTVRAVTHGRRRRYVAAAIGAVLVAGAGCASHSASTGSGGATSSPPSAESPNAIDAGTAQRLDAAINQAMSAAAIPGAIIGVWGPEGRYIRTFGVADKATGAPMSADMYSRIGSETKTFTLTAVLQLADQRKLGLDDPIGKYIDGVPEGNQITLRELARMQSGLYNYSATTGFQQALFADPRRPFTPIELLGYAFAQPSVFPPGQGFQYSNTNTVLLGLVVEKVSGQALPDFIRDHILVPLNLSHTSFPTTNAFSDPHPQGYTNQTADGAVVTATDWNPSWGWAAGAMISTLDDLHAWAPAVATGKLLSPAMQAQRLQTVNAQGVLSQYGYGLGIFNLAGWIGHNGSLPGYQSVGVYLPEQKRTLVILINTDVEYQGNEPSSILATAITSVISPDHVYSLSREVQEPDVTSSSTPSKPR